LLRVAVAVVQVEVLNQPHLLGILVQELWVVQEEVLLALLVEQKMGTIHLEVLNRVVLLVMETGMQVDICTVHVVGMLGQMVMHHLLLVVLGDLCIVAIVVIMQVLVVVVVVIMVVLVVLVTALAVAVVRHTLIHPI
jgi:hypothetical protein